MVFSTALEAASPKWKAFGAAFANGPVQTCPGQPLVQRVFCSGMISPCPLLDSQTLGWRVWQVRFPSRFPSCPGTSSSILFTEIRNSVQETNCFHWPVYHIPAYLALPYFQGHCDVWHVPLYTRNPVGHSSVSNLSFEYTFFLLNSLEACFYFSFSIVG